MDKKILLFLFAISIFTCGKIQAQSKPFNADIVVALDGSGDFTKIQDALDAVPSNSDRRTIIYIKRGTYNTEKLIVASEKKNVTFIGESRDETIISYHIYDCSSGKCPTEDAAKWSSSIMETSATLTIVGEGFRAENLTIRNTAGPVGQALAITVKADKCVFVNVNLLGYQDTIYMWTAGKRIYYENCLVVGRTDYIYGAGIAFFQGCEIRSWGGGWITAPSTPRDQAYGYVFNQCNVSFATGSPSPADDAQKVALGRPWHEYPKVAWMNCVMTDKIDPLGWPTKWNMAYADTSVFLKLLEYNNTGAGADMSGRANWTGLRAMTDLEAPDYTVQKVLGGSDNWDPSAEAPAIQTYVWTGTGSTKNWKLPENWSPNGIPASGEIANVTIADTLLANGDTLKADLSLSPKSAIKVTANSVATYLSLDSAEIISDAKVSLSGKIATKNANKINVLSDTLTLNSTITGVHAFTKEGPGVLLLNADNSNYSGAWVLNAGTTDASVVNTIGKGSVMVNSGAKLVIGNDKIMPPQTKVSVATGASLVLNTSIYLNEFYIDGVMQGPGEYDATSNPTLISGTGKIIIGRPTTLRFIGGASGTWDVASYFSPAILPITGDTVLVGREIETTNTVFPANMILEANLGKIRPRGNHTSNGWIEMNGGTKISYATGGTGFIITANEIRIKGNISFDMNTNSATTHIFTLPGIISSNDAYTIMLTHPRSGLTNGLVVNCVLGGNNANLSCTWDVTTASLSTAGGSYICLKGTAANSLGTGLIKVGSNNKVSFDHAQCIGTSNDIILSGTAKAILNANVSAKSIEFGGVTYTSGTYSATTNPDYFEGTGTLTIGNTSVVNSLKNTTKVTFYNNTLHFSENMRTVKVFDITGRNVANIKTNGNTCPLNLESGIYLIKANGKTEIVTKIFVAK